MIADKILQWSSRFGPPPLSSRLIKGALWSSNTGACICVFFWPALPPPKREKVWVTSLALSRTLIDTCVGCIDTCWTARALATCCANVCADTVIDPNNDTYFTKAGAATWAGLRSLSFPILSVSETHSSFDAGHWGTSTEAFLSTSGDARKSLMAGQTAWRSAPVCLILGETSSVQRDVRMGSILREAKQAQNSPKWHLKWETNLRKCFKPIQTINHNAHQLLINCSSYLINCSNHSEIPTQSPSSSCKIART